MRILMFGWEFPPHISGGLGTACFGLTQGLSMQGVDVLFVVPRIASGKELEKKSTPKPIEPDKAEEDLKEDPTRPASHTHLLDASDVSIEVENVIYSQAWDNVKFMEVAVHLQPYLGLQTEETTLREELHLNETAWTNRVFQEKYEFSGSYGANLKEEVARYALVAARLASTESFDLIHAHDWLAYPAGIAAQKVSGKPLVSHIHATEFDRSGENVNSSVYDIEKQGMQAADRVIAVSNLTARIVEEKYGVNPEKIRVVHNAVMPREKSAEEPTRYLKEKVVTFLGRITFQKGPEYFVEAAYKILQKDSNVRFVMAGSGDLLQRMVQRVAELRISSRFHFTGFLKGPEVDQMFGLSDVYVMPSVSEPFGISPLEAMRSNVPVIISKQSGVAEVLQHALKVDFWDINAMADMIYGLIHYPALSRTFVKFGKEEVDSLQWNHVASKVKDVYQEFK